MVLLLMFVVIVMDESGEQFVAYFLPTDETMAKRAEDMTEGVEYKENMEYEYKMAREYDWNVKSKASKGEEENFFFLFRGDGVYYNELETRVRVRERRKTVGQQIELVVKHRSLNKQEMKMQMDRERNLEPQHQESAAKACVEEQDMISSNSAGERNDKVRYMKYEQLNRNIDVQLTYPSLFRCWQPLQEGGQRERTTFPW